MLAGQEAGGGRCIRGPGAGCLKLLIRTWGLGQAEAGGAEPGSEVKQVSRDWQEPRVMLGLLCRFGQSGGLKA